jgi:hypothetical protein
MGKNRGPQIPSGQEVNSSEYKSRVGGIYDAGRSFVEVPAAEKPCDVKHRGEIRGLRAIAEVRGTGKQVPSVACLFAEGCEEPNYR